MKSQLMEFACCPHVCVGFPLRSRNMLDRFLWVWPCNWLQGAAYLPSPSSSWVSCSNPMTPKKGMQRVQKMDGWVVENKRKLKQRWSALKHFSLKLDHISDETTIYVLDIMKKKHSKLWRCSLNNYMTFFCLSSYRKSTHSKVHQDGGDSQTRHPRSHAVLHGLRGQSL